MAKLIFFCQPGGYYAKQMRSRDSVTLQPEWEIMKHNNHIFTISLGAASFAAMIFVVSMISVPKASETAIAGAVNTVSSVETVRTVEKAAPIILAPAHSAAAPQTILAAAKSALPQSIPVPCPIWILGQLTGYSKTTIQTADGVKPNPKLVPGGIWFMQKFSEAVSKSL